MKYTCTYMFIDATTQQKHNHIDVTIKNKTHYHTL